MTLSHTSQALLYPMDNLNRQSNSCFVNQHPGLPSPMEEAHDISHSALDFDVDFESPLLYSKDCPGYPHAHEAGRLPESAYPSPPSTSSEPKQSVPLPGLPVQARGSGNSTGGGCDFCLPFLRPSFFGGILDSPLVMQHAALKAHTPLSPPPTQPTSTLALPPADNELTSIDEGSSSSTHPDCSYRASSTSDALDQIPRSPPPHVPPHLMNPLLSPLSPEWQSNGIEDMPSPKASDEFCLLSCDPPPTLPSPIDSFGFHRGFDDFSFDDEDDLLPSSSASTSGSRPILSLLDIPPSSSSSSSATPYASTPFSLWHRDESISPNSILPDVQDDDELIVSPPSSGPPHTPLSPHSAFRDLVSDSPKDPLESLAYPYFPHPSSPSIHSLRWLPDLEDGDIPLASPSPSRRSLTPLPEFSLQHNGDILHHHLKHTSTEHDFHLDGDVHMLSPPQTVLSLPGATTDDDLLPASLGFRTSPPDMESFAFPSYAPLPQTQSPSSLLLLLDEDPNDALSLRSPSPENFTLDPAVLAELPESHEVQKLSELRKKAQLAEKAARQKEHAALMAVEADDGGWSVQKATEARKLAKRERAKAKEISTLLRLKLGERSANVLDGENGLPRVDSSSGSTLGDSGREEHRPVAGSSKRQEAPSSLRSPSGTTILSPFISSSSSKKPKINSVAQLVAKMIFSRHDVASGRAPSKYRPLWMRGIQQHQRFLRSSPLARAAIAAPRIGQHASGIGNYDEEPGGRDEFAAEPGGWTPLRLPSFDMDVDPLDDGQGDDSPGLLSAL